MSVDQKGSLLRQHWKYITQFVDIVQQARCRDALNWTTDTAHKAYGWAQVVEKLASHYLQHPSQELTMNLDQIRIKKPDVQFTVSLESLSTARQLLINAVSESFFCSNELSNWLVKTYPMVECGDSHKSQGSMHPKDMDANERISALRLRNSEWNKLKSTQHPEAFSSFLETEKGLELLVASRVLLDQLVSEEIASTCRVRRKWETLVQESNEALAVVVLLLSSNHFIDDFGWGEIEIHTKLPRFQNAKPFHLLEQQSSILSSIHEWALSLVLGEACVDRVWELDEAILGIVAQTSDTFGISYYKWRMEFKTSKCTE